MIIPLAKQILNKINESVDLLTPEAVYIIERTQNVVCFGPYSYYGTNSDQRDKSEVQLLTPSNKINYSDLVGFIDDNCINSIKQLNSDADEPGDNDKIKQLSEYRYFIPVVYRMNDNVSGNPYFAHITGEFYCDASTVKLNTPWPSNESYNKLHTNSLASKILERLDKIKKD